MDMTQLHSLISDDHPVISRDSRKNRPYHKLFAQTANEIYSTILPIAMQCESILDVGCNIGAAIVFLRQAGWKGSYVGTDLQQGFIDIAKSISPNEEFIAADCFEVLSKNTKQFDLVICLGVAHVFVEPFSLFSAVAKASKKFVILDAKDVHSDIDGNPLVAQSQFTLISSHSGCPLATGDTESFSDTRGLGCSITPDFVELFMHTQGFGKEDLDTSLLQTGVYTPLPRPHRIMQCFSINQDCSKFVTLQDTFK